MRIVIAGGTGFLGSPLAEVYAEEGHDVRVLTRGLPPGEARDDPGTGGPGGRRAGGGMWDRRWPPTRKAELWGSRIVPPRSLVAAITSAATRPPVFISASGC